MEEYSGAECEAKAKRTYRSAVAVEDSGGVRRVGNEFI